MYSNNNVPAADLSEKLVKDIVLSIQGSAEVFENYGIDFCCGGNKTLQSACAKKGLSLEKVEADLLKSSTNKPENLRYENWDLDFLTQYIVNNHHSYVKSAIPAILRLTEKISAVHGERHPFLAEVKSTFETISMEMISHMRKEEEVLFKMINLLAENKRSGKKTEQSRTILGAPINMMEMEHDSAGSLTEKIRTLTDNYTLPADACTTFAVTYKELQEFERDLHKHVFLENNILFPRAIELETELLS